MKLILCLYLQAYKKSPYVSPDTCNFDCSNVVLMLESSSQQEAHKMVHEANVKQAAAEKQLKEAQGKVSEVVSPSLCVCPGSDCQDPFVFTNYLTHTHTHLTSCRHSPDVHHFLCFLALGFCVSQIDVLQAEVTALKTLVLTSTPSSPNRQLHPQLQSPGTRGAYKHGGGHIRNKSASGALQSSPGKPDPSSVSLQPGAKEEREVTRMELRIWPSSFLRIFVCGSLDPPLVLVSGRSHLFSSLFLLSVLTLCDLLFFLSVSGISSSLSLLFLLSSLWYSAWSLVSLPGWHLTITVRSEGRG